MLSAFAPPPVVTTTLAVPAVPAGTVAVISVSLAMNRSVAAVPPMVTLVAPRNPVPVIVTELPPATDPVAGLMAETVGAPPTSSV